MSFEYKKGCVIPKRLKKKQSKLKVTVDDEVMRQIQAARDAFDRMLDTGPGTITYVPTFRNAVVND